MGVRGVFEGGWGGGILHAFTVGFRGVVNLTVATNGNKNWFAITNSASNEIPSGGRTFTMCRRTTPEARSTISVHNRRSLAGWTRSNHFTEQQTEGRSRA